MASQELSKDIQIMLDRYSVEARRCFQSQNFEGFEQAILNKWEALPEPKSRWEEGFRIASTMIKLYILHYVNFQKADEWFKSLLYLDEIQRQHPGEVSLLKGKIHFEKGELTEAKKAFDKAYKDSEGHCFGTGDEKYLNFFQHPEKYINQ